MVEANVLVLPWRADARWEHFGFGILMQPNDPPERAVGIRIEQPAAGRVRVILDGHLDGETAGAWWKTLEARLLSLPVASLEIDTSRSDLQGGISENVNTLVDQPRSASSRVSVYVGEPASSGTRRIVVGVCPPQQVGPSALHQHLLCSRSKVRPVAWGLVRCRYVFGTSYDRQPRLSARMD